MATYHMGGAGAPDMGAVDRLGRLTLAVRRSGGSVEVHDVSPAMAELLWLAALPLWSGAHGALTVEAQGQVEGGEEPLGVEEVQEEAHRRDPPP